MAAPLLECQALACAFPGPVRAVEALDLRLEEGELVGLIGPDGAGKTTSFRMLMGLQRPGGGRILRHIPREAMGYVPQAFALSPDLTVEENLRLQARLHALGEARDRIEALLRSVDLAPFRERLSGALSGGMKQKLALCAALLPAPRLLLLDEPTTGVDPVSRREFWAMLHRVQDQGVAILFSTPYMDEAEYAHRMLLMAEGRILSQGTLEAFRAALGGLVLALRVQGRGGSWTRDLEALGALDVFREGGQIRARFPEQEPGPLLARVRALRGAEEVHPAQASLEDCFLHLLREREAAHA